MATERRRGRTRVGARRARVAARRARVAARPALAAALALALAGCATAPAPDDAAAESDRHPSGAGEWALTVLATPYLLAFKGVACVASLAVAPPTAALYVLTNQPNAGAVSRSLGEGIDKNCGPPYHVSPYARPTLESETAS